MQLEEALRQVSDIRRQMARSELFRGYRSITVAFSGVAGLAAAAFQPLWVPTPEIQLGRYLGLWLVVAAAILAATGAQIYWQAQRSGSRLARQQTLLAVEQFLPSVVVGALATLCVWRGAPQVGWILPGLWALFFGLGICASHRLLPRHVLWVAFYYMACGCLCLSVGNGAHALSPWLMGISFGGGQLLGAAVLYWTLERDDVSYAS